MILQLKQYIWMKCICHIDIDILPQDTILDIKKQIISILYPNIKLSKILFNKIYIFRGNTDTLIDDNETIDSLGLKDKDCVYFQYDTL
jgi:hypothetical protein